MKECWDINWDGRETELIIFIEYKYLIKKYLVRDTIYKWFIITGIKRIGGVLDTFNFTN